MLWRHIVSQSKINFNSLSDLTIEDEKGEKESVNVEVNKTNKPTAYKNAAIIYIVNNQTLLLKLNYSSHGWSSPGGNIDNGEGPLTAALRELKEETGIVLDLNKVDDVKTYSSNEDTKLFIIWSDIKYPVKLSNEHTEFKWVELDDILNMDLMNYAREAFKEMKDKNII